MATIIPVIVPVMVKRNCIVVENKKYCEERETSKSDLGVMFLIVFGIILYVLVAIYLSEKLDYVLKIDSIVWFLIFFLAPFLLFGLYLI